MTVKTYPPSTSDPTLVTIFKNCVQGVPNKKRGSVSWLSFTLQCGVFLEQAQRPLVLASSVWCLWPGCMISQGWEEQRWANC